LDAMSDVSESSDSDEELLHVMDPSDPRAHRPAPSVVQPTRVPRTTKNQTASRWDSDNDDVGEPISVDSDVENQTNQKPAVIERDDAPPKTVAPPTKKPAVKLSKWAARFLVPASERKIPVFEEPPLEPLNDFILSDFGSRFRGDAGDVKVEKEIAADGDAEQQDEDRSKVQVGAPLFDANTTSNDKENDDDDAENGKEKKSKKKKKNTEDGRKRKENSSNNSSSNGRRVTGRKRGRDAEDEYPDYNGYDEDEDYYSNDRSSRGGKKNRNRGGSSRPRKNSGNQGYARLNEALPTRPYRSSNNSYGERRRNSRR
ncbi:hypothetical protein PF007_g19949, partial [Phytophthora fragariae]